MKVVIVLSCVLALGCASPLSDRHLKPLFPNGRIVGGVDTDIKDIPYQVALEKNFRQFCGGTLISDSHVLTAAHCVGNPDYQDVRVGSSRRGSGGKVVNIAAVHVHPKYNARFTDYDAAILQLAEKVEFGESVKQALVPNTEPQVNTLLKISGWGTTKENGVSSTQLQSVLIPMIDRERCKQMYSNFNMPVTDRMICAYVEGKDSCHGDSGGPAVSNGYVYGIVSWGKGCARLNYPGVYANVAHPEILQFIRAHTKL